MIVYVVVDNALSPDFPLGDAVETFIRREDAERFVEEVRGDDPEMAAKLRIEERELEAGGLTSSGQSRPPTLAPNRFKDVAVGKGRWRTSTEGRNT